MPTRFWPLARGHTITDTFGWQAWRNGVHWAVDFGREGGSGGLPVYAVQGGTAVMVGPASGFGQWVVLDHPTEDGGGTTVYGHVIPEVALGQRVEAGQRIARINPDSRTNGGVAPHLHLEWHRYVWSPPGPNRLDPLPLLQGAAYPGESPAQPEEGRVLYGIDISNHQGEFDFAAAKVEGFTFATHKVTEGDGYRDPLWPRAREQMREHFPGAFGGYVFCRQSAHPEREADLLLQHLGDPSIPIQLDYEDTDGGGSVEDMWARIQAIEARGMRVFATYVPRWYWQSRMGSRALGDVPALWNSHYVTGTGFASTLYETQPATIAAGWADFHPGAPVHILQFSETARVAGQQVDVNAFRGTESELRALFSGGTNEGVPVTDIVEEGAAQLHPHPGLLRQIRRPENVSESTRDPRSPWPYAMWADMWNETVWDGYDIRPEYADVPDDVGRSMIALLQTVAARQIRIEQKLDQLIGGGAR